MDNQRNQFSDGWAIVLGGSSGFGLAAVEKLARHGMHIAVLYRETAAADRAVKDKFAEVASASGVTILTYNSNALEPGARASFLREFGTAAGGKHCVRLLLHSIARGNLKPLVTSGAKIQDEGMQEEGIGGEGLQDGDIRDTKPKGRPGAVAVALHETLSIDDIQLTSYAMSTSLLDWARDLLKEEFFRPDGRIIGLTSEGAHKFWEGYAAVSIAKASLESLAMYMAIELGKYGLRTNLIQAGVTETPSLKRIPASKSLIELSLARNPLGRMTRPEDVAGAIYLLCTDEAAWINGAVIHVDGGEHCL